MRQRLFSKITWSYVMDNFGRRPVNHLQKPGEQPQPGLNSQAPFQQQLVQPQSAPQPIDVHDNQKPKKSKKKLIFGILIGFVVLVAALAVAAWMWYAAQLAPVDSTSTNKVLVKIESGTTPTGIAEKLKANDLIRNVDAFLWYTRSEGVQNKLQAGTYRLSPSESTQEIVTHLISGNVDTFDITFIPGETLADSKKVFLAAGYSESEIDTAFRTSYDSPLFQDKPATADLEGYIYPDTYRFGSGATVQEILEHTFEQYYKVIQENDLIAKFKAQNLTLFEGIVMASIIQKEAVGGDERQIAQVFLKRQARGMMLGSDPTYQYITDKRGVPRDLNYDSPYNTRRYAGIPPGPIANPGLTVLKAVADPAPGEYLYFLSGDDDITYFSMTFEEHEQNIVDHCKIKCQAL